MSDSKKSTEKVQETEQKKVIHVSKKNKQTASKKDVEKTKTSKKTKGPGVIASIYEFVQAGPVKQSAILKKLVERFPQKKAASLNNTLRAQIGSNKRPVRMEREKGVTFVIVVNEKTKEKTYSMKK